MAIQLLLRGCYFQDLFDISHNILVQFPVSTKNFLNFWFGASKKQMIINLSYYRSKSYAPVVFCDPEVTFLMEGEDTAFCPSVMIWLYTVLQNRSNKTWKFLVFYTSRCISWPEDLLLLPFVSTMLRSWVNCPPFNIFVVGLVGRVFTNGPGDLGSIPGCVIPKTLKMVLDAALYG